MPSKRLLIMLGPQGAGNHMFSKIFASSPLVGGWKELNTHYWKGHHTEPFANVWAGEAQLTSEMFDGYDYWTTSCSVPFVHQGKDCVPNIKDFIAQAHKLDIDVCIALITRDANILNIQQSRVRGQPSTNKFFNILEDIVLFHIFSHESLLLLEQTYVDYITQLVDFPIINLNPNIIAENANAKYIHPVNTHWLDEQVQKACDESKH
jgi:hypothetical protein